MIIRSENLNWCNGKEFYILHTHFLPRRGGQLYNWTAYFLFFKKMEGTIGYRFLFSLPMGPFEINRKRATNDRLQPNLMKMLS
jgi:hypothetical protein